MMRPRELILGVVVALTLSGGALATDCVDVDIEAPGQAYLGETITVAGEVTNCGDEAAMVVMSVTFTKDDFEIVVPSVHFFLAAGETRSRSKSVQIPPAPVAVGVYTVCVTATIGDAEDTDCATTEVLAEGNTRQRPPKKFRTR